MLADAPELPGWRFATRFAACAEVSGDFYEFIKLDDGRVGFAIGDVSGHGVQAGLIMSMAKKTLEIFAATGLGPADCLARVNEAIARDLGGKMFVSMCYGVLDPAAGELTLAPAFDEGPRHAPDAVATRLRQSGSGWVLDGAKAFVPDGHSADRLLVSARIEGSARLALVLVERAAPGVAVERVVMADQRNSANVRLAGVAVAADAVLGGVADASAVLARLADIGNAHLAAELLGLAAEVFQRTVEYLNTRKQFGVLIGSYQGLQHRAAHLYSELELLKSLVLKTLQALDAGSDEVAVLASLAKAKAGEVATLATNEAVQMHGGVGMTDELEIGFFMKRARVAEQLYGDHRYHLQRYAALCGY